MTIGIYEIENIETGQKYRGQSINIERRIKEHKYGKETKTQRIDRAIKKYGWDSFIYKILESFDKYDKEILDEREKYWIAEGNTFNNSFHYNLTPGGDGLPCGKNHPFYDKNLDDDKIVHLYINEGKSTHQIADELGSTPDTIANHLRHNGIEDLKGNKRIDLDNDTIYDMYINKKMTVNKIAKELNTCFSTIKWRLNKMGIEIDSHRKRRHDIPDSNQLLMEYNSENVTKKQLAEKYNCTRQLIYERLKEATRGNIND